MFSCVWLHFKKCFGKYLLIFGCILENTIENTFSICCSHFLTFSQIFLITKRIYNIIYSSKHKQNPEKNHQIRTNEGEIAIAIGASCDASIVIAIARRSTHRAKIEASIAIAIAIGATALAGDVAIDSFFLPLSLSTAPAGDVDGR